MPYDPRVLDARLRALLATDDLARSEDVQILGVRLGAALAAAPALLGADGAGLMLLDEHEVLRVVGASDRASGLLELAQERSGAGPGVDCVRTGLAVAVDDLAAGRAYPRLWQSMVGGREAGLTVSLRAVVSVPVVVGGDVIGTMNVTSAAARCWTAEQVAAAGAYAGVIAGLLRLGLAARQWTPDRYDEEGDDA